MTEPDRNVAQIDYWNGEVGRRWAELQDRLDAFFVEVTDRAMLAAAAQPGERTLDIGCGCGATLLELARRVGPHGAVSGFDVSDVMLSVAQRRIESEGLTQARTMLADAATHRFEPDSADLVFSRFGVMFFDRPTEAFANIRTAIAPGGRLDFVCWRPLDENGWVTVPLDAVRPFIEPEDGAPADPHAPGPFAFADPVRLRGILAEAGFSAIGIEPADVMLRLASAGQFKTAANLITQIGPVSRALKAVDETRRAAGEAAVARVLESHDGSGGIRLPAAIWVVTARA